MYDHILITGGAGFIGSHLASALVSRGHKVTILDNLSEQIHGAGPETSYTFAHLPEEANFVLGDVTDALLCEDIISNKSVIVHLAAETGTGQSMYQIQNYCNVNVGGTATLLEQLVNRPHSIRKIVVASSRAVYGEGKYFCLEDGEVFPNSRIEADMANGDFSVKCPKCFAPVKAIATDEESALKPGSIYGITKLTQEKMVASIGSALGIATTGLRYQNVYGPGQSLQNPYTGILSIFTSALKTKSRINIFEDGKPSRDFVFIDDVVDATVRAIEMDEANDQVFNVGSGKQTDVTAVVQLLEELHGTSVTSNISGDFRSGDIRHNFADLCLINRLLGFHPKWDFRSGLKKFANWSRSQEAGHGYSDSLAEIRRKGLLK